MYQCINFYLHTIFNSNSQLVLPVDDNDALKCHYHNCKCYAIYTDTINHHSVSHDVTV